MMKRSAQAPLQQLLTTWRERPEVTVGAVVLCWFAVNVWFPSSGNWAEWLLVDWLKRIVLLVPLVLHPEIGRWIRSAFTQGVYRYESIGLFVLRVFSVAVLLLVLHYVCEWIRWGWLQPLDPGNVRYPEIEDPYWRRVDLVLGLALVAFSEEIVHRVVLLRVLLGRMRHEWAAIAVSAVVFGLFHFNYGFDNVLSTALLGAAFAIIYRQTQTVWPLVAGHYLINFAVFA